MNNINLNRKMNYKINLDKPFFLDTKDIQTYNLSVSDLFDHYRKVNFIYEEKEKRIKNYYNLIQENWELALKGGEEILWTPIFISKHSNHMASISLWRTTLNSWFAQHMTSTGDASGLVSLLLNTMAKVIVKDEYNIACQNWYNKKKKVPDKIYKKFASYVGSKYSSNTPFEYLEVKPLYNERTDNYNLNIVRCNHRFYINDLKKFVSKIRGDIYLTSEQFDYNDIELDNLNVIYKKYGLFRKRFIWIAYKSGFNEPVGAAICYRGPLGFNLSFLENRCDLLINERLNISIEHVCNALIKKAACSYFDISNELTYPLDYIPVVTSGKAAKYLKSSGSELIRQYNQCICLKEGFVKYYNYLENMFSSIIKWIKMEKKFNN